MRPTLLGMALLVLICPSALAQESIFDPENPALSGSEEEDDGGGPESIFDSENPNASGASDESSSGSEQILDPDNPRHSQQSSSESSEPQIFTPRSFLRGGYQGRFFADTGFEGHEEDIFLLENRLDLRAKVDFSENWTAVLEGRLEHSLWGEGNPDGVDLFVNGEHFQGQFEASLRDAFLSGRFDNIFITVGNQSVVWGAGTLTQPSDVINPLDYGGGTLSTPADQRLSIFAVELSAVFDRIGLSAVLVPFFRPHKFSVFGTDFAFFNSSGGLGSGFPLTELLGELVHPSLQPRVQDDLAVTEFPEALPENMSAGARFTSTYGGVDLGVGYFFGWDRTPFLEMDEDMAALMNLVATDEQFLEDFDFTALALRHPDFFTLQQAVSEKAEAGEVLFRSTYRRRHTVEVDMVTYWGQLGIRLESAFTPGRTQFLDGMEAATLPVWNNALAFSYERSESLAVHVEGFWVHTFDIPKGREILLSGEDFYGCAALFNFGLAEFDALDRTEWASLSFQVAGIVGLNDLDVMLYPSAQWAFSDALHLTIGGMFFWGPDLSEEVSIGGLYDNNDQAYISVDAAF